MHAPLHTYRKWTEVIIYLSNYLCTHTHTCAHTHTLTHTHAQAHPRLGLSEQHEKIVVDFLHFARFKRTQCVKAVDTSFQVHL